MIKDTEGKTSPTQEKFNKHEESFELILEMIMSTRFGIRSKAMQIFKEIFYSLMEEEEYSFNPIQLMHKVISSKINLEDERVQINEIERLQNIFRKEDMSLLMQRIYLRFLIGMFRVKFIPLYPTIQKALAELLVKYHDTLMEEYYTILDTVDIILRIGPFDNIAAKELYPNLEEDLPTYRSFVILEAQNGEENEESIDNQYNSTLSVFQNLLKSLTF